MKEFYNYNDTLNVLEEVIEDGLSDLPEELRDYPSYHFTKDTLDALQRLHRDVGLVFERVKRADLLLSGEITQKEFRNE